MFKEELFDECVLPYLLGEKTTNDLVCGLKADDLNRIWPLNDLYPGSDVWFNDSVVDAYSELLN